MEDGTIDIDDCEERWNVKGLSVWSYSEGREKFNLGVDDVDEFLSRRFVSEVSFVLRNVEVAVDQQGRLMKRERTATLLPENSPVFFIRCF